ncbi:MAG: HNH endonuclease [Ferrovum myxofaciens]|uniref:HNH endonuclease n=1 Tax=Ferrovum myxofaciens TaxID=416213 RepID=A0A9E6SYQ8_9PROT|nr:MAG: HNH endonuclease [Ferrovum myxofaciens]QWY76201.1 MAG: HNH endonuclease [Ferrovum myxofaciens]QWY78863.1 MAG: HNH endonuclease [Ferrovum myxofaciens]
MEIDHIFPWSEGGETIEENLQSLCFDCNRGKGARC